MLAMDLVMIDNILLMVVFFFIILVPKELKAFHRADMSDQAQKIYPSLVFICGSVWDMTHPLLK